LAQLGATTELLTDEQRTRLDDQGYLPLPGILSEAQVQAMRTRFDELVQEEGEQAGTEVHQEVGTNRLSDLANKGEVFEVCISRHDLPGSGRHHEHLPRLPGAAAPGPCGQLRQQAVES
jgi:hypothetical protein